MVLRRTVEMSLHTLLTAMRWHNCGEPHPILLGGASHVPPSAEHQRDCEALEELGALGLVRGRELVGSFEDTLHVLDRPDTEYYAQTRTGDDSYGVLVACRGREAVTVAHQDGTVWLTPVHRDDRALALAKHLPPFPPADFQTFSARQAEFARPDTSGPYEPLPARSQPVRDLHTILDQPYYGIGQLYVARRQDGGPRHEAPASLSYIDIDVGRVGLELTGPADNQHITVFPGDPGNLAERLTKARAPLDP
ncbi:ESX secretion-associated protein EspG [Amycolatopsis cihanbeyliensis]|uniref:ESAT-6 protein secretion system EspG family protein n=1 Tax=Amycolatopsis cihanbeyliensis TaxID=1128664 RepID=A0A542DL51_AMYCI|nr:ESX secretion-associated protein EspG [Amycolatopsis cihanbeyliensis]TQJ03793.1 ESAT-6 protein secretion system EspG family protein [Amycolatopsis cihanbeyliensis]